MAYLDGHALGCYTAIYTGVYPSLHRSLEVVVSLVLPSTLPSICLHTSTTKTKHSIQRQNVVQTNSPRLCPHGTHCRQPSTATKAGRACQRLWSCQPRNHPHPDQSKHTKCLLPKHGQFDRRRLCWHLPRRYVLSSLHSSKRDPHVIVNPLLINFPCRPRCRPSPRIDRLLTTTKLILRMHSRRHLPLRLRLPDSQWLHSNSQRLHTRAADRTKPNICQHPARIFVWNRHHHGWSKYDH